MSLVNQIQHLHFKHVFPVVNFCFQPYCPSVISSGLCLIAACSEYLDRLLHPFVSEQRFAKSKQQTWKPCFNICSV